MGPLLTSTTRRQTRSPRYASTSTTRPRDGTLNLICRHPRKSTCLKPETFQQEKSTCLFGDPNLSLTKATVPQKSQLWGRIGWSRGLLISVTSKSTVHCTYTIVDRTLCRKVTASATRRQSSDYFHLQYILVSIRFSLGLYEKWFSLEQPQFWDFLCIFRVSDKR